MRHRIHEFFAGMTKFVSRPWYVPLVAFFAALDSFVVIIPIDALLIARVLGRRRHWLLTAVAIAFGSALGALALAAVVQHHADWILGTLFKNAQHNKDWLRATEVVQTHGAFGIFLVSLSPIPQHPAVIVAALAKFGLSMIFLATLAARLIKYGAWAALAAHAPKLLMKFPPVRRTVQDFMPSQSL